MWDQTDPAWLAGAGPDQLGTGLYLLPDPRQNDPKATRKLLDPDVTYAECRSRGDLHHARAIKWVPYTAASHSQIAATACGAYCKDSCVEFGCICDEDRHVCV